jgi:hypothetical protein
MLIGCDFIQQRFFFYQTDRFNSLQVLERRDWLDVKHSRFQVISELLKEYRRFFLSVLRKRVAITGRSNQALPNHNLKVRKLLNSITKPVYCGNCWPESQEIPALSQ